MHKSVGLIMASTLLSYSVLVPFMANAQTETASVSTSSVNVQSMTTAQISSVQEPVSATTRAYFPTTAVGASNASGVASNTPSTSSALPSVYVLPDNDPASTADLLPATSIPSLSKFLVTLTSYNAVAAQTSATPWITASGATSNSQVIAARSRDLANKLPFGTIIAVMGPATSYNGPYCGYDSVSHLIGYRVIADTMAARMHNKVDIMLNQNDTVPLGGRQINPSIALGACTGVQIQVVGFVNPQHIPSTQKELAALVTSSQNLAYAKF